MQPGQIHVESHVTLAEDKHDTQSVTVYLLVLQEIYSVDGESLTLENGSYIPTAITFSLPPRRSRALANPQARLTEVEVWPIMKWSCSLSCGLV